MSLFPKSMSLLKFSSLVAVAITALQRATFSPITVFKTVFKTVSINNTMIGGKISIISILSIYNIQGQNNIICHFRSEVKARHNFPKTSSLFCNPVLQMRNSIKTSQVKIYPAI